MLQWVFDAYPFTVLYEISQLLNTQLDKATLATCVGMVENGVNPDALAVCPYPHQLWTGITSI